MRREISRGVPAVIEWRDVSFSYAAADGRPGTPVLRRVDLVVNDAELALVAGRTGCGKSTLLGTVNGLVPHFSGGQLTGEVRVGGRSVRGSSPRELADLVGYVGQDPLSSFVTERVEDELAYGMEQLGLAPQTMRRRVEETLDLLGIADLRARAVRSLSGGQQQRVAIGAVLTMHPRVLVLDEPTSALDPTAAEDVLGTLARLVEDLGLTVVVAEHRMERVIPFADRLLVIEDGIVRGGPTAEMLQSSPVAPPVVELGRLAGWQPLAVSVREARRRTPDLLVSLGEPPARTGRLAGKCALQASEVVVRYGGKVAVREVSISVAAGQVVALMGRNGCGKSSLLWALQGAGRRDSGSVDISGADPAAVSSDEARALMGLVPQSAADLLYLDTVAEECHAADQSAQAPGACAAILERLAPGVDPSKHPRDLSEGQRLCLVLAIVLTARPQVIALDEPTRGLDYAAKAQLARVISELAAEGSGVIVATHDVEFVAQVADQVVVMAGGEVVSAGLTDRVLAESPAFAPQMSKILGDRWLTVDQVREALV